jgi:F0F1-type ATP synthase assembly protein I
MAETPEGKRGNQTAADLGRYTGLGLQFAASLVLFGALGWWIDGRLSTTPWLMILGMVGGSALAFVSLLRAVPSSKSSRTSGSEDGSGKPPRNDSR